MIAVKRLDHVRLVGLQNARNPDGAHQFVVLQRGDEAAKGTSSGEDTARLNRHI